MPYFKIQKTICQLYCRGACAIPRTYRPPVVDAADKTLNEGRIASAPGSKVICCGGTAAHRVIGYVKQMAAACDI
jgi:hypothetical protein